MTNVTNVVPEPYLGSAFLVKLLSGGYFTQVKYGLIVGASILLAVLVISFVSLMCNLVIYAPTMI